MAKEDRDDSSLGKVLIAGRQPGVDVSAAVFSGVVMVIALVALAVALVFGWFIAFPILAGIVAIAGLGFLIKAFRQHAIRFELRKKGIAYESGPRELELEWEEVASATVQMVADNPLLALSGVNNPGHYVMRRANDLPFRLILRGSRGEAVTVLSHVIPVLSRRKLLEKIEAKIGEEKMNYELSAVMPQWIGD